MAGQASVAADLRSRPTLGVPVRLQHVLIIGAALVLALTGLPQRLDFLPPSRWVMDAAGGIESLRTIHRGAGAVLIGAGLYHAVFVFFSVLANRRVAPLTMIPDARDYRDAILSVLYFTGMRRQRPALREPTYFQKLDYWVLAWGITAMGVTGIIRLFPARITALLGGDVVAAALEFHSDVALLAVVWLVVIHLAYPALTPHRHEPESGE
jgi:cytochrome b subunit of formate dehydrogenase